MTGISPEAVKQLRELLASSLEPKNHIVDMTTAGSAFDSGTYGRVIELEDPNGAKYSIKTVFSLTLGELNGEKKLFRHATLQKYSADGDVLPLAQRDSEVILYHLRFMQDQMMVVALHPGVLGAVAFFQEYVKL